MPVKQITKTVYECTCVHPTCKYYKEPWQSDRIPSRCAGCKRRNWNRPSLINRNPITFAGKTQSLAKWAKELDMLRTTLAWRMEKGWPLEQVLSNEDWRFGEEKKDA